MSDNLDRAFTWLDGVKNVPRGKRNNPNLPPIQSESNERATQVLSALLPMWLDSQNIDTRDAEQVTQAITQYFITCSNNGLRPMLTGLLAYMGIKYRDYANNTAVYKRQTSDESRDVIKKGHAFISAYLEQISVSGHLNPPVAIFLMKNYTGLTDEQKIEISPKADLSATQTAEQIEQSIPLEIEQTDDNTQ